MPFVPDAREPSVSVEEHITRILDAVDPLPPYDQPLLEALGLAAERGADHVEIVADSELIVRQIQGRYRVRNPGLIPLHARAKKLIAGFGRFVISHVPRKQNREADRLVGLVLKRAASSAPGESVHIVERPE